MGQISDDVAAAVTDSMREARQKQVIASLEIETAFLIQTPTNRAEPVFVRQCSPMERFDILEGFGIDPDDQDRTTGRWALAYRADGILKVQGNDELLKKKLREDIPI